MFDNFFDRLDDWYRDHREPVRFVLIWLLRFMILVGVYIAAFCMTSCRSQQITRNEQYRDSTLVHHRYDTTHIQIYDTTRIAVQQVEKTNEGTIIHFVSGGGSLNLHTGEVSGVRSVQSNRQKQTDTQTAAEWHSRVESLQATSDSLRQVVKCYQIASERKTDTSDIRPARSGYDKFCSAFFWCVMIAGIIALAWWLTNKRYGWWTVLKALMRI